jgi:hypothetical protein
MAAASEHLAHAVTAVVSSAAALANTATVAALASALASLVKRAVQFTKAATLLSGQQPEPGCEDSADAHDSAAAHGRAAAAYFPVALATIAQEGLQNLAKDLAAVSSSSSSSSSSNRLQARTNAAMLAVVAGRSLVQAADAMEAQARSCCWTHVMPSLFSEAAGYQYTRTL